MNKLNVVIFLVFVVSICITIYSNANLTNNLSSINKTFESSIQQINSSKDRIKYFGNLEESNQEGMLLILRSINNEPISEEKQISMDQLSQALAISGTFLDQLNTSKIPEKVLTNAHSDVEIDAILLKLKNINTASLNLAQSIENIKKLNSN